MPRLSSWAGAAAAGAEATVGWTVVSPPGPIHTAWKPLAENIPERLDRQQMALGALLSAIAGSAAVVSGYASSAARFAEARYARYLRCVEMRSARCLASCQTPQMKLDPLRDCHGSPKK
jgi:hypothetical protein